MKKSLFLGLALVALMASCQKSDVVEAPKAATDILIVNNGNWGASDASISSYNIESKSLTADMFFAANSQKLGDLAQDILAYKDNILIAVNGSKLIFVCDKTLKIVATIDNGMSPRYFTVGGDKIYVTYYEGYLGEITPSDWSVRTTAVGPNPEGLAYIDGCIYVANSGGYVLGYNNTMSVVDAASFKEKCTIKVNTNPNKVVAYNGNVFVTSNGNYADIAAKLQKVSAADLSVSDVEISGVNGIALGNNGRLYVLSGEYDASWTLSGTVTVVDAATGTVGDVLATAISKAYSISASGKYIFVGCSDYLTDGTMIIYNEDGTVFDSVDTQGLNPICALAM